MSESTTEKVAATADEKALEFKSMNSATSPTAESKGERDLDDALKYLHDHTDAESEGINLSLLRRKIDWRIVPIMFACYVLQFIDKVVINVSFTSIPYAELYGFNSNYIPYA
jgi:hypothetical protein